MDITKLMRGSDSRRSIDWPGSDKKICIRVLSEHDYIEAEEYCDSIYAKDRPVNLGNVDERNALRDTYCMYLAIVDDKGIKIFPDFTTFTDYCTPEVRAVLIAAQNEWQAECAPAIDRMTDDQMDDLLNSIKKNIETVRSITDSRLLRRLIISMVSRQQKLPMVS